MCYNYIIPLGDETYLYDKITSKLLMYLNYKITYRIELILTPK